MDDSTSVVLLPDIQMGMFTTSDRIGGLADLGCDFFGSVAYADTH